MAKGKVFFKVYVGLLQDLEKITGAELKVLISLCFMMGFSDNTILMERVVFDTLEEQLQMSHRSLMRVIRALEKKGVIKRHSFYLTVSQEFAGKRL